MKCPHDGTELSLSERSGVEIDYCPQCRGVWLDKGEVDKIIERAAQYEQRGAVQPSEYPAAQPQYPAAQPQYPAAQPQYRGDDDDDDRYRQSPQYGQPPQGKKRKSFLGDIFDF